MAGYIGYGDAIDSQYEYKGDIQFETIVDDAFKLSDEFFNKWIYSPEWKARQPKTYSDLSRLNKPNLHGPHGIKDEDMNGTFLDTAFRIAQDTIDRVKLKIKDKDMSEKNFRVTERDLLEFNAYIKSKIDNPRLLQYFKSRRDYEDYMNQWQDDHLTVDNDPAIVGNEKRFSLSPDNYPCVMVRTTNPDQLSKLMEKIKDLGNGGHSFDIVVDPDCEEYTEKFMWDGDGSDSILSVEVTEGKSNDKTFSVKPSKENGNYKIYTLHVYNVDTDGRTQHYFASESDLKKYKNWLKTKSDYNIKFDEEIKLVPEADLWIYILKDPNDEERQCYRVVNNGRIIGEISHISDDEFKRNNPGVPFITLYTDIAEDTYDNIKKAGKLLKSVKKGDSFDYLKERNFSGTDGKCPADGCIQKKPNGKWGVISNKTGEFWDADYDSEDEAKRGLAAYHANKHFSELAKSSVKNFAYAVYQSGGNIGESGRRARIGGKFVKIVKTGLTEEEAKDMAKRWNDQLTPGEKSYYHIRYGYRDEDKIKYFSDVNFGFNPTTGYSELTPEDYTMPNLIGSALFSVTYIHLFHFTAVKYPAHMALNEYYDEMPELVDALAEHWLGDNEEVYIQNVIVPKECPIEYLEKLRAFAIEVQKQLPKEDSSYASEIDDIVNQISSTLYKLKRLRGGRNLFTEMPQVTEELPVEVPMDFSKNFSRMSEKTQKLLRK